MSLVLNGFVGQWDATSPVFTCSSHSPTLTHSSHSVPQRHSPHSDLSPPNLHSCSPNSPILIIFLTHPHPLLSSIHSLLFASPVSLTTLPSSKFTQLSHNFHSFPHPSSLTTHTSTQHHSPHPLCPHPYSSNLATLVTIFLTHPHPHLSYIHPTSLTSLRHHLTRIHILPTQPYI